MPPLGLVVIGQVLVIVDLSINSFDLVPDVVGWPVIMLGLARLWNRNPWFRLATVGAGIGLLVAVLRLVGGSGSLVTLLDAAAQTAVIFGVCSAVLELVASETVQRSANWIRWSDLVLGLLLIAGFWALDGELALVALVLVLLAIAVLIWFLVFCWQQRDRPELSTS